MSTRKKALLTQGPILATLLKLALPMIWGIFVVMTFNLVDTYFVGQLGTLQLGAMGFTFPVVMLGGSLAMGLGIGTSSVISRAIGESDTHQVRCLTTDSLILSVTFVGLFITLGLLTIDPLFTLMGAGPELLPLIREYMQIWYIGLLFLVIPMVGNSAIRATGDTLTPSVIMTVAGVANIALDPLLIFGYGPVPAMGLRGAALATVGARALTLVAAVGVLHFRERMLLWRLPSVNRLVDSWKRILYVGLPAALTNSIAPLANAVLTALVASFGVSAVAGFGVATRIEAFALIPVMGLSAGLGPFVGQNWGAKEIERVQSALNRTYVFSVLWGILVAIILLTFRRNIAQVFNENPEVIQVVSVYLFFLLPVYAFEGWRVLGNSTFNAIGKPLNATAVTLGKLGTYVMLAYGLSVFFDLKGVFMAGAVATALSGVISWLWTRKVCRFSDPEPTHAKAS